MREKRTEIKVDGTKAGAQPGEGAERRALAITRAVPFARHGTLRLAVIGLLLVAVTLDRYTVMIVGLHVKLEHVMLFVLLGAVVWGIARGREQVGIGPLVWIAPFLAVLLLASVLNAPDREASLRHAAMVALVASATWVVYRLVNTPERFRVAVRMLAWLGALEAVVIFAALIATQFGAALGTQPGNGEITVPHGTLWEPNILGSYLAAAAMLLLSRLLGEHDRFRAIWLAGGLALALAAVGLSLARAAWLGTLVGGGVVLACWWWQRKQAGVPAVWTLGLRFALASALVALLFLVGVAPFAFPSTAKGVWVRIDPRYYTPQRDPSVQLRAAVSSQALEGIRAHPIIGNGAGSFETNHTDEKGAPGWIGNLELHLLYDSGLLGAASVLIGIVATSWLAFLALRRASGGSMDVEPEIIGLLGALAVLLVAFQATEGTWLAFTWVYLGLLARAGSFRTTAGQGATTPPGGAL